MGQASGDWIGLTYVLASLWDEACIATDVIFLMITIRHVVRWSGVLLAMIGTVRLGFRCNWTKGSGHLR